MLVAEAFGKFPHEVRALPLDEFERCAAWALRRLGGEG